MSVNARKSLPEPEFARESHHASLVPLDGLGFAPDHPEGSPARQLQWQLYRQFAADRHAPAVVPYPMPVRIALLAGGALGSWAAVFLAARQLFHILD